MRRGERLTLAVIPKLAAWWIRLLHATLRVRHVGREPLDALEARGDRYIHAFWHGRLLMMPYSYRGDRITVLISQHRDGEYISRTLQRLGFHTTRGSTTRGGVRGLRAAVRRIRQGFDLGITPDGPRGPRHRVQAGVVEAARLSGAPIVPVTFSAHPARRAGSWDRFLVPWPFARALFLYGEPVVVPRRATAEAREEMRRKLEEELTELTERADRVVRGGWGRRGVETPEGPGP